VVCSALEADITEGYIVKTIRNLKALTGKLVSKYDPTEAQRILLTQYNCKVSITRISELCHLNNQDKATHPADVETTTKVTLTDLREIWKRGAAKLKTLDGRTAQAKVIKAYLVKIVQQGQALKAQGA